MQTQSRNDVYRIITDRIIEQLQKGVVPWRQSWGNCGAPSNLFSHKKYNGFNSMLLASAGFKKPYYITFKQCLQLGGKINTGEHGWPVIYWKVSYLTPSGKYIDGKLLTAEQRLKYQKRFLLRYYKVWNVEQCTGIEQHIPAESTREPESITSADNIVANFVNAPTIEHTGSQAYYAPTMDLVRMPEPHQFKSNETYYTTLFHELIHSTGHAKRLDRKGVSDRTVHFGSYEYSKEELVAELGACFLANHAGFLTNDLVSDSASYINGWCKKLDSEPQLIINASAKAQQAADYILNIKHENVIDSELKAA